ncbi:MAG: class I SAM-dependent methyltransferase [Candidatus Thorarchaeota archaeon]
MGRTDNIVLNSDVIRMGQNQEQKSKRNLSIYDIGGILGTEAGHFGGMPATARLLEIMEINPMEDKRWLEIGCGSGTTSCFIAERFPQLQVIGIDLSKQMIASAKKRAQKNQLSNAEFLVANAHNLPFKDNFFDVVIAESATGVIPDKSRLLREYLRVLKPGGKFGNIDGFLTSEAAPEVGTKISELMTGVIGSSIAIRTSQEWKDLFRDAGFSNIRTEESRQDVLPFTTTKVIRKTYVDLKDTSALRNV